MTGRRAYQTSAQVGDKRCLARCLRRPIPSPGGSNDAARHQRDPAKVRSGRSPEQLQRRLTGRSPSHPTRPIRSLVDGLEPGVEMRPAASSRYAPPPMSSRRCLRRRHGLTVGVQATGTERRFPRRSPADRHATSMRSRCIRRSAGPGRAPVSSEPRHRGRSTVRGLRRLNGSSSDVRVVGYTTGGGVGPHRPDLRMSADRVRAFDVVTGDGVLRRADNPSCTLICSSPFAEARGRRWSRDRCGVRPRPRADVLIGGACTSTGAAIPAVIDRWRSWSATLPETATTSFVILQLPDAPGFPPPLACGRMSIGVPLPACRRCRRRSAAAGAELRSVAPVILDDVAVKPYAAVDSVRADPVDPLPAVNRGMSADRVSLDEAVRRLLAIASARAPALRKSCSRSASSAVRMPARGSTRAPSITEGVLQHPRRRHGAGPASRASPGRAVRRAGRLGHRRHLAELPPPTTSRQLAGLQPSHAGPAVGRLERYDPDAVLAASAIARQELTARRGSRASKAVRGRLSGRRRTRRGGPFKDPPKGRPGMADKKTVRALLERYCTAMNERRREDWLDCFADDAVQEDPVGTPANVGREAIGRFFDGNDIAVTLSVTDDPLVVGNEVLAFFTVVAEMEARAYEAAAHRRSHRVERGRSALSVAAGVLRLRRNGPCERLNAQRASERSRRWRPRSGV